jgi:hypothetical protein
MEIGKEDGNLSSPGSTVHEVPICRWTVESLLVLVLQHAFLWARAVAQPLALHQEIASVAQGAHSSLEQAHKRERIACS